MTKRTAACEIQAVTTEEAARAKNMSHMKHLVIKKSLQFIRALKPVIGVAGREFFFSFTDRVSCSMILLNLLEDKIRQNEERLDKALSKKCQWSMNVRFTCNKPLIRKDLTARLVIGVENIKKTIEAHFDPAALPVLSTVV